jgi:competence protein ComEC
VTDPSLADGVSCDDAGCVVPKADGALVALSLRADALADDCVRAGLVCASAACIVRRLGDRSQAAAAAGRAGVAREAWWLRSGRR